MLRSIVWIDFPVAPRCGDGAKSGGGPDPRDPAFQRERTLASPPFRTAAEQEHPAKFAATISIEPKDAAERQSAVRRSLCASIVGRTIQGGAWACCLT
jgi:hypothetical protein